MSNTFSRRSFVKSSLLATLGCSLPFSARAAQPFKRAGAPRLMLSLAAYSFRDYFKDSDHKRDRETDSSKHIDLFQFIDYCAAQGCQGAELTSYYFPASANADFLLRVKRHAFLRGVAISGTAVGNTFTHPKGPKRDAEIALVKKWVDHAAILGAPHIRVFAGNANGQTMAEAKTNCIEALAECCDYSGKKGVFLGIENHGGIVAESAELLDIIQAVDSPWIGINLDTGNFHTADPYADLVKCAPYAVNVQFKAELSPKGKPKGQVDMARIVSILREANYQGYVALEYESAEDPYTAVPRLLRDMKSRMG